jgi:hypothetical protein
MARTLHPKKEVEGALRYAENSGWRIEMGGAHAWGKMYCPFNDKECRCGLHCITSIWSTPKNAGNYAKAIRRVVDNCNASKRLAGSGTTDQEFDND